MTADDARQGPWAKYQSEHPWAGNHTDRLLFFAGWDAAVEYMDALRGPRTIPARSTDPDTSHRATEEIKVRAGTQRAKLLQAFALTPDFGLTDEEAALTADGVPLRSEYAKRCSELREAGLIEPTGETRKGGSGQDRMVSWITAKGRAWIEANQ